MKRTLFAVLTAIIFAPAWADVEINETNFPDYSFRSFIQWSSFNEDYDDVLTSQEIANATSINVGGYSIANLKGIEYFTALTELNCSSNQLTSLDLSKNKALTAVSCYSNQLNVEAMDAFIASLPTVSNGKLYVSYSYNESNLCTATHIAAAKAKGWTAYDSDGNEFAGVVVLCHIDESSFPDENFRSYLTNNCVDSNGDGYLTDTEAEYQTYFDLSDKGITTLKGIEFFTKLTSLYCQNNQLTSLDVSMNTELTYLYCYSNKISGAQMDALVTSLPKVSYGAFRVIDTSNENEGNACSVSQVETATSNGWEVYYQVGGYWDTYYGIMPILIDDTVFPDANFRGYVASSIDTDQDGKLSTNEMSRVYLLDVSGKGISNLKGIELFTTLNTLCCNNNQLTSLDVSMNTELTTLYCDNNQLTSLDLSKNTALTRLNCYGNKISGSMMDALIVSLPTGEEYQTYKIFVFDLSNDDEANTCTVEQVNALNAKSWDVYYRTTNSDSSWEVFTGVLPIIISDRLFPDEKFYNYMTMSVDTDKDGKLSASELSRTTALYLSNLGISNLKGIELFTELTYLDCTNNNLSSIDLSENTKLTTLKCSENQLTTLDLSRNIALTELYCDRNKISGDGMKALISNLPKVSSGKFCVKTNSSSDENICWPSQVESAKEKGWTALYGTPDYRGKYTYWNSYEGFEGYYLSDYFTDENFRDYVSSNYVSKLTESGFAVLANITELDCSHKRIANLQGIELFSGLISLDCSSNDLTTLDLSGNSKLTTLNCSSNNLTTLDLSGNSKLTTLNCSSNNLTTLDLSANKELTSLRCYYNQIWNKDMDDMIESLPNVNSGELYIIAGSYSYSENNICTISQVGAAKAKGWTVYEYYSEKEYMGYEGIIDDLDIQTTFTDEAFRNYIIDYIDKNNDGIVSLPERIHVVSISVQNMGIKSLTGIEHFTSLQILYCDRNQLTTLDMSKNAEIQILSCNNNQLTTLNVSNNTALRNLSCGDNQLTTLNVSNTKLYDLRCYNNQLTTLDVSNQTELTQLYCNNNQLKTLTTSNNTALNRLDCYNNQLTTLVVSGATVLETLYCDNNRLTQLSLYATTALKNLGCYNNQLTRLDLSDATALEKLLCYDNQLKSIVFPESSKLASIECYHNDFNGKATDDLIESLPIVDNGVINFIDLDNDNEGNVCFPIQVAEAEAKGWTLCYRFGGGVWDVFSGNLIKGDINGDGSVDKTDLEMVVSAIMGQALDDVKMKKADVNGDKAVDAADVTAVVSLINYAGQDNILKQIPEEDLNGWEIGYLFGDEYIVACLDKTNDKLVTMINKNGASVEKGLILCFNENNVVVSAGTVDKLYDVWYKDKNIIFSRIDEEGIYEEITIPTSETVQVNGTSTGTFSLSQAITNGIRFVDYVVAGSNGAVDLTNWKWEWGKTFRPDLFIVDDILKRRAELGTTKVAPQTIILVYVTTADVDEKDKLYGDCTISIDNIEADNGNTLVSVTVKNANNLPDYLFNKNDRTQNDKTRNLVSCGIVVRHLKDYVSTTIYDYKSDEKQLNGSKRYGSEEKFTFTIQGLDLKKSPSTFYFRPYLTSSQVKSNGGYNKYGETKSRSEFNGELKEFKKNSTEYSGDEDGRGSVEFLTEANAMITSLDNIVEWGIYVLNENGSLRYEPAKVGKTEDLINVSFTINREDFRKVDINFEQFTATKRVILGVYQKMKDPGGQMLYFYSKPESYELVYDEKPNITFTDVTVVGTDVQDVYDGGNLTRYKTSFSFDFDIKGSFWISTIQYQISSSTPWLNLWNKEKITKDDSYTRDGLMHYGSDTDMNSTDFYQMNLINGTTVNSTNSLVVGGVPDNPTMTLGGAPNTSQVRAMTRNNNSDKPNCITSFVSMRKKQKEADKE